MKLSLVTLIFPVISSLLLIPSIASANTDAKGTSDHSLVGRYPGSYIFIQTPSEYEEAIIPLEGTDPTSVKLGEHIKVEGKILSTVYATQDKLSTLKIIRSYEQALQQKGFNTLFKCSADTCGDFMLRAVYPSSSRQKHLRGLDHWKNYYSSTDWRFLTAQKKEQGKNDYVIIVAAYPLNAQTPRILVEVIEEESFQAAQLTTTTEQLTSDNGLKPV